MKREPIPRSFTCAIFRAVFDSVTIVPHSLLLNRTETLATQANLELFLVRLPVKVFKTLYDRQSYIVSKFHKIERWPCDTRVIHALYLRQNRGPV